MMRTTTKLRKLLEAGTTVVAPGVYDGLTARLVEKAGFPAAYVSGGAVARGSGIPDLGLVSLAETAARLEQIVDVTTIPVIADADNGYGNALNAQRTAHAFERAGIAAFHLEDQTFPKRCGHYADKSVVPVGEMVGKLKAVRDALHDPDFVVIARTDAIAVEGLEAALERAGRYVEAGADVLFIEAPRSLEEMKAVTARFAGRVPLLANMVEGGKTPMVAAHELQALGFAIAIFPGAIARALGFAAREFYASLRQHGSTEPMRSRMLDFQGLNRLIGTPEMLELGKRYDKDPQG